MNKLKYVIYAVIYLAGLAVLGVLNIATIGWDWSVVTKEWVLELNLYNVLYYSFFVTTLMLGMDTLANDTKLVTTIDNIELIRPKVEGSALQNFVDEVNWFEKVEKHKEIVSKRKANLSKKYLTNAVSLILAYGKPKGKKGIKLWYWHLVSKKAEKYTKKMKACDEQLTEQWIDDNLLFTKVVYPQFEYSELLYGTLKIKSRKSRFVRSYVKTQVVIKLPLLLLSTLGTILMTVVQVLQFNDLRNLFYDLGVVLIILSANVMTGLVASRFSHRVRVADTNDRLTMLIGFKENTFQRKRKLPIKKEI